MKKILLTAVVALFAFNAFSQVKIGLRGGFASQKADANQTILSNNDTLGLMDVRGGYHFGAFTQIKMKKFFIQPEILFNSSSADFTLSSLREDDGRKTIIQDQYNTMDIPVMMGYKAGSFRVGAGPVGHVHINEKSELLKKEGFKDAFKQMTYGYQVGVGLDLWKVVFDIKYEGNFTDFDEFINFDDMNIDLADAPSRWVVSFGYAF